MSETVSIANLPMPVDYVITDEKGKVISIVPKDKPDTFEKKTKTTEKMHNLTPMGVVAAGAAALGTGKLAFEGIKKGVGSSFGWVEQQVQQYAQESGKVIKGLSDKAKANIKFGVAGLGAILMTALVFRDKDKDGKLDILESLQKFRNPGN